MIDLISTRAITIDENNLVTGLFPYAVTHKEICSKPWKGFYFLHPSWMGKTEWFRKHRYTVPAPYFCEDQELLLRSYRASCFETIDEILMAYRIKRKVDKQKLVKTRCAVFKMQLQYFVDFNFWHYLILAFIAFIAKIISDCFKSVFDIVSQIGFAKINNEQEDNWNKLLDSLTQYRIAL